jgi:hypothetical protein
MMRPCPVGPTNASARRDAEHDNSGTGVLPSVRFFVHRFSAKRTGAEKSASLDFSPWHQHYRGNLILRECR